MNLLKNTAGPTPQAMERIRQDLDTIQRNFNALQAYVLAPIPPQPDKPATFSSANVVTTTAANPIKGQETGDVINNIQTQITVLKGTQVYVASGAFGPGAVTAGTEIQAIPPYVGQVIAAMWMWFRFEQIGNFGATTTLSLRFAGSSTDLTGPSQPNIAQNAGSPVRQMDRHGGLALLQGFVLGTFDPTGKALNLHFSGTNTLATVTTYQCFWNIGYMLATI